MNAYDNIILRRALLFGVPATYMVLLLFHPTENPVPGDDVGFWMVFHVVQLFLIGGMACIVWILTAGSQSVAARVGRAFILPYAITYSAFEAMAGLTAGDLVRTVGQIDPADQPAAERFVDEFMAADPAGVAFYIVVQLCFLAAMGGAVLAQRRRIPTGAFVLLSLGTVIFAVGHPRPFGPVGMACILIGMVWMELGRDRTRAPVSGRDEPSHRVPAPAG